MMGLHAGDILARRIMKALCFGIVWAVLGMGSGGLPAGCHCPWYHEVTAATIDDRLLDR